MQSLLLLDGVTAVNGKPSTAAHGKALRRTSKDNADEGFSDFVDRMAALVWSSAGSGAMDVEIRMWVYLRSYTKRGEKVAVGKWFPIGVGADSSKGTINMEGVIGETDTDSITHCEVIDNLMMYDRVYAEVVAINGTATAVNLLLRAGGAGRGAS